MAIQEIGKEHLRASAGWSKQSWMTEEILQLMDPKSYKNKNIQRYIKINRVIKINRAEIENTKKKWL